MSEKDEYFKAKDYREADIDEPLPDEVKEHIEKSLQSLWKLYEEEIKRDGATIQMALEYLPFFNIHGLLISSMLGVTMEEYYMVTETLAMKLGYLSK